MKIVCYVERKLLMNKTLRKETLSQYHITLSCSLPLCQHMEDSLGCVLLPFSHIFTYDVRSNLKIFVFDQNYF